MRVCSSHSKAIGYCRLSRCYHKNTLKQTIEYNNKEPFAVAVSTRVVVFVVVVVAVAVVKR